MSQFSLIFGNDVNADTCYAEVQDEKGRAVYSFVEHNDDPQDITIDIYTPDMKNFWSFKADEFVEFMLHAKEELYKRRKIEAQ
ncbi:MAG: hypothetical protein KA099_03225 [Alphaproteobacteria bacterium]|nr:hypothetical protein [Alphaproteobacteria bacterium]MBP7759355.1 hypothetical protein [Alphaproteobacteria bacterium]MBP7762568.1 hypothetical protein [Alphaproteobacteria bacterium]MBP7904315.1 hypothetical protein [Alphaproteobacteria bacterium]